MLPKALRFHSDIEWAPSFPILNLRARRAYLEEKENRMIKKTPLKPITVRFIVLLVVLMALSVTGFADSGQPQDTTTIIVQALAGLILIGIP